MEILGHLSLMLVAAALAIPGQFWTCVTALLLLHAGVGVWLFDQQEKRNRRH